MLRTRIELKPRKYKVRLGSEHIRHIKRLRSKRIWSIKRLRKWPLVSRLRRKQRKPIRRQ